MLANSSKIIGAKYLEYLFLIFALIMLFYQLYYVRMTPYEPTIHAIMHLGLAMLVAIGNKYRKVNITIPSMTIFALLVAGTILVTSYFFFNYHVILQDPSYPPYIAIYLGVLSTILCLVVVYWYFGSLFLVLNFVAVLYILYGEHVPGILSAPSTSLRRAVTLLATDVTSPWGLYGNLLQISGNYLFLFIIFGSILHAFGGLRFVIHIGNWLANKLRSGAASMAVLSSALLGSITGSTAANITITGSFTIPLMKDSGYKPEQAAAIEGAASNGGQFLPPIMGATVFVMSGYTGIPYISIAAAALTPALMYFFLLFTYAELNARKLDINVKRTQLNTKELLYDAPIFVIPLGVLVTLLVLGYSLMFVVFWSIVTITVVGLISNIRKEARINFEDFKNKLLDGIVMGSQVAILLAVIGIFVAVMEVTGLTLNLSSAVVAIAGENLFLVLIICMFVSLLFGIGLPTSAAYIIVATVISPILVRLGVPLLQAHLFPLFFAVVSHLTPPVGIGLLLANRIAEGDFYRSSIEVFKAGFVVLLMPFFFVYTPEILWQYDELFAAILRVLGVFLILFYMSIIFNNMWKQRLKIYEILLIIIALLVVIVFVFVQPNIFILILSIVVFAIGCYLNQKRFDEESVGG